MNDPHDIRDQFWGKTWLWWVQAFIVGGLGLFSIPFGVLFWTGAMTDANGASRPTAGPPLVIIGSGLMLVAVMPLCRLIYLRKPVIRCFRDGLECRMFGATSLDRFPGIPKLVRLAWAIVSLQGFRGRCLRVTWPELVGVSWGGVRMARVLQIQGRIVDRRTGKSYEQLRLAQARFIDSPQVIAAWLNGFAADPTARASLPEWTE